MKKYLFIFLLVGICFGQDKYRFFLKNDDNLKLLGEERYQIIKNELDKMLSDYKNKINFNSYWREKYIEKVRTGPDQIDEKTYKYYRDIYKESMGMEWAATEAKRLSTYTPTKSVEKERNREINIGEMLSTKKVKWNDIINYYGGYAELSKAGITKNDVDKFDLNINFEKVQLTSELNCLAYVNITGEKELALKFHKIKKTSFKYEGKYSINYDSKYLNLYDRGDVYISLKFNGGDYLPPYEKQIIIDKNLLPPIDDYQNTITNMFDDFVTNEEYNNLNPDLIAAKKVRDNELEILTNECLNELKDDIYKSLNKKYKKAKKNKFHLNKKTFKKNKNKLKKLNSRMSSLNDYTDIKTAGEMIDRFLTYADEAGLFGTKLIPDPQNFKIDFLKPYNCDMEELLISPRGLKNFEIKKVNNRSGSSFEITMENGKKMVLMGRKPFSWAKHELNSSEFNKLKYEYPYKHLTLGSVDPDYLYVKDNRYGGINYKIPIKQYFNNGIEAVPLIDNTCGGCDASIHKGYIKQMSKGHQHQCRRCNKYIYMRKL
jgi:hypothetical protein